MPRNDRDAKSLVLLVDPDPRTRHVLQPLLADRGLQLVHARTGLAALELLQRVTDEFRLAIVSLDLPGLSGLAVMETLRQFRPTLPVMCLTEVETAAAIASASKGCLAKPLQDGELAMQLDEAISGGSSAPGASSISPEALARARARFEVSGDLVGAALELARGFPYDV